MLASDESLAMAAALQHLRLRVLPTMFSASIAQRAAGLSHVFF